MLESDMQRQVLFPPFRLDRVEKQLYCGQQLISLRPKTFAVLEYLVQHAGRSVSKDDLLDAVWPETAVSDTVLKVCVRELRGALGDHPKQPRFIETAHRSGYRFLAEAVTDNLPLDLTSFVGRERELAEVARLLSDHRLVSLVGAGGSGKTRLAAQVARQVAADFEDGAWWIELAALTDAAHVAQAIASVLGVREQPGHTLDATLVRHFGPRHLLLVFDNCEHLVETCADLAARLLHGCPRLQILATSRSMLPAR